MFAAKKRIIDMRIKYRLENIDDAEVRRRDGIKGFAEESGMKESDVEVIVKSLFKAVRRMVCVEYREVRLKYLGSFVWVHSDVVRSLVEGNSDVYDNKPEEYKAIMEMIDRVSARKERKREKHIAVMKRNMGEDFDIKRYEKGRDKMLGVMIDGVNRITGGRRRMRANCRERRRKRKEAENAVK